ncbi:hypothetical protein M438DRAFT_150214 [Aureobasidium pullulans EXF-150]|uniref:Uncharacterized protein n=1 Tax=Aureobasidium pullulans EXF-150 TaxID=1043002 RepID=A0A074X1M4_AURPU|nr:uncharacterized protein M438DRAFT_150214 [Aureobasidium pullulans EXF-150]KEQ79303.1 hypothetical protein M438DRAFT_150214 [Aureobasidium pullulans EXF-150]
MGATCLNHEQILEYLPVFFFFENNAHVKRQTRTEQEQQQLKLITFTMLGSRIQPHSSTESASTWAHNTRTTLESVNTLLYHRHPHARQPSRKQAITAQHYDKTSRRTQKSRQSSRRTQKSRQSSTRQNIKTHTKVTPIINTPIIIFDALPCISIFSNGAFLCRQFCR